MISSEQMPISYEFKTQRFILSKTELRCVDEVNPDHNFVIALNEVNPNYFQAHHWNVLFVLGGCYFFTGFIVSAYTLLTHPANQTALHRLMLTLLVLIVMSIRLYKILSTGHQFCFRKLSENKLAFALPFNRKSKVKVKEFMRHLVKRIREAPLSNMSTLGLLGSYQLLTQVEMTQLDATIRQQAAIEPVNTPVIIHLKNRRK
jgi:hypothetical protein